MEDKRNKVLSFVQAALELAGDDVQRDLCVVGKAWEGRFVSQHRRDVEQHEGTTRQRERSPAQALGDVHRGGRSHITPRVTREQRVHQETNSERSLVHGGSTSIWK